MMGAVSLEILTAEIFSKDSVRHIDWPDSASGKFVKELFLPMMEHGISRYVRNIHAELFVVKVGDKLLPISVLEREYENSPMASPYTMYTSYTLHELNTVRNPILRRILLLSVGVLCRAIQPLLKASRFNRVVLVNGYPFSTALYPLLNQAEIEAIRGILVLRFPQHAIVFRTVDDLLGCEFQQHLVEGGFRMIYHRPAYHLRCDSAAFKPTNALRRDLSLLRKTRHQIIRGSELAGADITRIAALYNALFIDKYSHFNPQYTEDFFHLTAQAKSMEILALKNDGRVDGFIGLYDNGRVLVDPFLGHDQGLQRSLGIYRMLVALAFQKARRLGIPINYSAGVGLFKRRRGCELAIEYLAVFVHHLPMSQRLPWKLFELCNRIAILVMKKVEF